MAGQAKPSEDVDTDPLDYEIVAHDSVPAPAPNPNASTQERMRELQQWLQPTDYLSPGGEFMKHLHSYVQGTGDCIRESPDFREWIDPASTPRGCLHVRGVAGSGKSVFAASTIRQLQNSHPGTPVLFFFFRQIVEKNHNAEYLVRDYASQLLPHSPVLFSALDILARGTGVDGVETTSLWDALVKAISHMDPIFCIADALDEMDDECFGFLTRLAELGTIKPASVKVLLTSRPVPKIEEALRGPDILRLRLDPMFLYPDVARYVETRLSALSPRLSPKVEELTKNTICERAQGLFLHGRLTTDNLTEGLRDGRITEATLPDSLEALPRSLLELYEGMLRENARRSGVSTQQQARILSCITHSTRPLRLIELGSLAAHMTPGTDLRRGKEIVRASCGQLLEVLEDESMSVIHHSFTEFLNDPTRASIEGAFPVLDADAAHAMLATVLLEYMSGCPLLSTDYQDGDRGSWDSWGQHGYTREEQSKRQQAIEDVGVDHPLLGYALENLLHHLKSSSKESYNGFLSAMDKHFVAGKPAFTIWMTGKWKSFMHSTVTPLHVAARTGWPGSCIRHLVASEGADQADTRDEMLRTALSYAAEEGHTEVVGVLLEHGADATAIDHEGYSVLHYACMTRWPSVGWPSVAKLLLDAGADPLTARTKLSDCDKMYGLQNLCETPLSLACGSGNTELFKLFLPLMSKKDADLCFHCTTNSLHLEEILKTGLVNVNSYKGGESAMARAMRRSDLESIKLLLKYGANANLRSTSERYILNDEISTELSLPDRENGPTPLHAFAGYGNGSSPLPKECDERARQILRLLLDNGADINATMKSGLTPLHCAVSAGVDSDWMVFYEEESPRAKHLAELLLEAGADPNSRTQKGNTPLHLITYHGAGALDSLVHHGADLEAKNQEGRSPLLQSIFTFNADQSRSLSALKKLVNLGADVKTVDNSGHRVLDAFALNLSSFVSPEGVAFLQKLVRSGADIKNVSLMKYASTWRYDQTVDDELIIKAMIDEGLDINLADQKGETVLHALLRASHVEIPVVEKYIRLGADPTVRTLSGSTLFHAAGKVSPDWIRFLVSLGADPLVPDADGNTLIHLLISRHARDVAWADDGVESLVKAGIDPKAKNSRGATALHLVKSAESLGYILGSPWFAGLSVSDPDAQGETPLHAAAEVGDLMVKILLDRGTSPDVLTHEGFSPLHYAARPGRSNAVLLLLSWYKNHGVLERHLNLRDNRDGWGYTPLQYACSVGGAESVRCLLSFGADPSVLTARGLSPLHTAVGLHPELAIDLSKGRTGSKPFPPAVADELETRRRRWVRSQERHRKTRRPSLERDSRNIPIRPLLHTADIVELLADSGSGLYATFQSEDGQLLTPMDLAVEAGNWVMVRALAARGASPSSDGHAATFRAATDPARVGELAKALLRAQENAEPYDEYNSRRELDAMVEETIAGGEYDVIKEFARLRGGLFLDKQKDVNIFEEIVASGNTALLENFATEVAAFESERRARRKGMAWRTLLGYACERELPSLHIVKTLVETIKVDVNAKFNNTNHDASEKSSPSPPSEAGTEAWDGPRSGISTALHALTLGRSLWKVEALGYLLDHGADIEARDAYNTPLLSALTGSGAVDAYGHAVNNYAAEIVRLLLDRGADMHAIIPGASRDGRDVTSLDLAQDATTIKLLLDYGMPVPTQGPALLDAVGRLDIETVRLLLEAGCDPNHLPDFRPRYCLHEASRSLGYVSGVSSTQVKTRQREIVRLLLENGAGPAAQYADGSSVIQSVIEERAVSLPLLDSPKLDLNLQSGPGNRSLLISASAPRFKPIEIHDDFWSERDKILSTKDVATIHALLDQGADPLLTDSGGRTALHWFSTISSSALDDDHKAAFATLVERSGPEVIRAGDNEGATPPQLAVAAHNAWTIQHLLSAAGGADPALFGAAVDGNTALHHVAAQLAGEKTGAQAAAELFAQLVAHPGGSGLDINARNSRGDTPALVLAGTGWRGTDSPSGVSHTGRDYAKQHDVGYGPGIELLAGLGADLHAVNGAGQGMLHLLAGRRIDDDSEDQVYHVERAFKKLLDLGLDPRVEDGEMRTAIDLAVARDRTGIRSLFSEEGKGKPNWEERSVR
ncbi:hypothetical protein RB595_000324 [Gaeumannomyces hyphopodioides]